MLRYLNRLTNQEKETIFLAPVYVTLLAALEDGKITEDEKSDGENLSHIRTFSAPQNLREFYKGAEIDFHNKIEKQEALLPTNLEDSRTFLHDKLNNINSILNKLDKEYTNELKQSLHSFANHVIHTNFTWVDSLTLFVNPLQKTTELNSSENLFIT